MKNYLNVNIPAVKKPLLNRLIYTNIINPISEMKKGIFVLIPDAIRVSPLLIVSLYIIEFTQEINRFIAKFVEKNFSIKRIGVNHLHKKIMAKKLICQHVNCGHKSKSEKQLLMHHDKLEEECVKEKNLLLKLIMLYQNASVDLLENKENNENNINLSDNNIKFEENIGIDDEKRTIWINYINNCNLDDELKYCANLIQLQSEKVINNSTNDDKYKGILDN